MLTVIGFPLLILNQINLLVAILLLTQANGILSMADEKPEPAAAQVVALDDTAITYTLERLKQLPRTSIEVADRTGKMVKYSGVAV